MRLAVGALVVALIGVAAYFRTAAAFIHPLWLDEAYSAYAAAQGWTFLWTIVPRYETHPPFYYSLVRLWTLGFGDSLAALRSLGVAASLLTLPMVVLAGQELARILRPARPALGVPLAALLLIALAPYPIAMADEVRPYPVLILVYAVACFALLRIGRITAGGSAVPVRPLALYLAALALMLWLHNMGPLYAAAMTLALALLVLRRGMTGRDWRLLIGGHVVVGLIYLPGFLILVDQAPTWVSSTWLKFTTFALRWRLASLYVVATQLAAVAAGVLGLIALVGLGRSGPGRRAAAALLVLAIVPVALSIGISMWLAPVFIERTMSAAAIPALLLLAAAFGGIGWLRWPAIAALLLLAHQMAELDWRRVPGRPAQNWYPAVRWLDARFRPGDLVFAYPNEGALPFAYAVRDLGLTLPHRSIPTAVPTLDVQGGWYPTGSRGVASLPRERLRAIAQAPEARAVPTIWLLRLGANAYDVGDVFLDELGRGRVIVARYKQGPIDIAGLRRIDVAEAPPPR
ncbi:MAG: hypothetical protein JWM75_1624 [Sphingomonas bacterium]|nr:hypothetical protein [Sphingomonas bacterium]